MNITEQINNYNQSLKQKFNAVCFDIDGTLTINDTKIISQKAIKILAVLLSRKIPIVFITGRGETGFQDFIQNIYEPLKEQFNIKQSELNRIYVLTNDGARLFYSSENNFLNNNVYISSEKELKYLQLLEQKLKDMISTNNFNKFLNLTYSKDSKKNIILNIRLVFEISDEKIINQVFDFLEKFVKKEGYNEIKISRGIFKNKKVIQIGTALKDKGIEKVEDIIGVPRDSMLRIGDCGDIRGNDYAMLNCKQGFSVNKTSNKVDACFPIFDENYNILKGLDATIYLINKAQILPTVCLEKANKKEYTYNYAKVEREIVLGRNNHLDEYNNIINNNFNIIDGIDGLFDRYSGSVKIPMYEWELIKNSPLKDFWGQKDAGKLSYSIRDDSNYLLRGSRTYYYFLANRQSINGKDITSKDNVLEWYKNNMEFLFNAAITLDKIFEPVTQIDKKMIIGILDNCRNILLVILNHKLYTDFLDKNVLLNLEKENYDYKKIYWALLKIESLMKKCCFEVDYLLNISNIKNVILKTLNILKNNFDLEKKDNNKEDYSKDYRAYREIDNFAENFITVSLYNKKNKIVKSSLCGLSYGGIELPILSKIINFDSNVEVLLLKFNKEVSGYSNKQLIDLRNFNINDYGSMEGLENVNCNTVDLFDDNVLTGKTLQLAINSLFDINIKVNNICIVRYPSINRLDQMFMKSHGAIDYHLFFDYINGLCFKSPYSWRDINVANSYADSLGVFDLNRKKIIECLIKNHDYVENSEVANYLRRLKK